MSVKTNCGTTVFLTGASTVNIGFGPSFDFTLNSYESYFWHGEQTIRWRSAEAAETRNLNVLLPLDQMDVSCVDLEVWAGQQDQVCMWEKNWNAPFSERAPGHPHTPVGSLEQPIVNQ